MFSTVENEKILEERPAVLVELLDVKTVLESLI